MATTYNQYDEALRSDQPVLCLREVVQELLTEGQDRRALLVELEHLRGWLRETGREESEDVVLEVMDFVVGWCSPHMEV
jgi:hypothetical protein